MSEPREEELLATWLGGLSRTVWRDALARAASPEQAAVSRDQLDHTPEPLAALEANTALIRLLVARRWFVVRDAIEEGATWEQVAAACQIPVQAVRASYRESIEQQELHLPDLHESTRSRAVLDAEGGESDD